ncbi:hypothetical protein HMSSN036_72870 [Paenibacillus macerans]|nr:hypothetical protein HMSSN036_72870 [Paenibacillus macerans]
MAKKAPDMGEYKYGFRDEHQSIFQSGKGLTEEIVRENFPNQGRAGVDARFSAESFETIL